MGLKKKKYLVESLGITLPEAYAQVVNLCLHGTSCSVIFHIQKDREAVANYTPAEVVPLSFSADRTKSLLEQAYAKAKETLFAGWEDDIVGETAEEISEETEVVEDGA